MISNALRQIRATMSQNKALAKKIPLVIKDRSQNERARFKTLLSYELHAQTMEFLDENHKDWLADPALFENHIKTSEWASLNPWTRAAGHYPETKQDHI